MPVEAYFSFWTYAPDDLLDRAACIFRLHLDYTCLRMEGNVYPPSSLRVYHRVSLFFHRDQTLGFFQIKLVHSSVAEMSYSIWCVSLGCRLTDTVGEKDYTQLCMGDTDIG